MSISWTPAQKQRLRELNVELSQQEKIFSSTTEREIEFKILEKEAVQKLKGDWQEYRQGRRVPLLSQLEQKLIGALTKNDFVQVVTPIILSKSLLEKMTITDEHPLSKQVFWLDQTKCLRPMLAPNLYFLLKDLLRVWDKPIRIFEIGSCFRKETQGANHLNEFTMLNLVEMGLPEERRIERLSELAAIVMDEAGIKDYQLVSTESEVYGTTVDIEAGIELGSGAMGPHALDYQWGINETWVGIGFGLERLVMRKEGYQTIKRAGRSLTYLDGVRLNI
ncbi:MAG: pyrrolysine--tRNA(Pyl) ligase large subunit [Clostridia bacterium]|jgi:phenylalanyl-tRNA synthetase alpha chain|nr:pyrrolysine--tRNA(Pyl) ligase large subunit [Clostridia bacterium]